MTRPPLAIYCQHSLGFGHLARSWTLAGALSRHFHVTLWCGGPLPASIAQPGSFDLVQLPPLAMNAEGMLVSLDQRYAVEAALDIRRDLLLRCLAHERPEVLIVELFPFGRKKFARELLPLLDAVHAMWPRPRVVCSLRDILVARGEQQQEHDERARLLIDRYFDAVLVHADPRFARLEESFRPFQPMCTPVYYTGFVAGKTPRRKGSRRNGILVSGGGGRFARPLFLAAMEAHRYLPHASELTVVAGPLCDESTWAALVSAADGNPSIRLRRTVRDLSAEMAAAQLSISQCGYNTALDIIRARVPALVVPFAERGESEQADRARRLERLGVVRVLAAERLTASAMAGAMQEAQHLRPAALALDLDGAERTASVLKTLAGTRNRASNRDITIHERLA
jgi:predicted glycosyltransferase